MEVGSRDASAGTRHVPGGLDLDKMLASQGVVQLSARQSEDYDSEDDGTRAPPHGRRSSSRVSGHDVTKAHGSGRLAESRGSRAQLRVVTEVSDR